MKVRKKKTEPFNVDLKLLSATQKKKPIVSSCIYTLWTILARINGNVGFRCDSDRYFLVSHHCHLPVQQFLHHPHPVNSKMQWQPEVKVKTKNETKQN